jgi:DNA-3-methyladenine glycosylase II
MVAAYQKLCPETLDGACRELADRDPALDRIYRERGCPPLWQRRPGFRTLVQIILEQQVSLASGRATMKRVENAIGRVTAQSLAGAGEFGLRAAGVTRQKALYCTLLARAAMDGELNLGRIARVRDHEALDMLTAFKGVGRWTAEVYLLMALRRPDVWPAGDLALAKALQAVKKFPVKPGEDVMRTIARPWRPFRAVAARMLWQEYLCRNRAASAASG